MNLRKMKPERLPVDIMPRLSDAPVHAVRLGVGRSLGTFRSLKTARPAPNLAARRTSDNACYVYQAICARASSTCR